MCVSSDDQILYISWIHVEHILTQWLHFTFYKELECALASVLLLSNQGYVLYTYSYYLLPFTKQMCVSWDDQILYISGIHVEHILTQWLHFTFYKELECALASVLLLSNQGYVLYTYSYYLLPFTKQMCVSWDDQILYISIFYIIHIMDTCWTHIDTVITFYLLQRTWVCFSFCLIVE